MIDLGTLGVNLQVNGQGEVNNALSAFGDKISSIASGGLNALKTGFIAVSTATVATGTALFGVATNAAETADRIDKLSHKIGISKQGFQEWDYIMGQNGMEVEKLQVGLKTLVMQMDAAQDGSEKAQDAFKKLGLSWTDGNGKLKEQETIMNEAIMALAKMENGTEKARLATELFGKAGMEMMPMLNGGAEGIEELRERAHELGLVISDEAVDAGVVLGDTLDDVKDSFGAIMTKIGVEVMPIVQKILDLIIEKMPQVHAILQPIFAFMSQFFEIAVSKIGALASSIGEKLAPAFEKISSWFSGSGIDSVSLFNAVFDALGLIISSIVDGFIWLVDVLDKYVFKNEETMKTISEVWNKIKELFSNALEFISSLIQLTVTVITQFWDKWGSDIINIASNTWEFIKSVLKGAFDFINDLLKVFAALFEGDWEKLWEAVKELFVNLWDNLIEILDNHTEMINSAIDGFGKLLQDAWELIWLGIKTYFETLWNDIITWFNFAVLEPVKLVQGIGTKLYNAGKEIFNSLWQGIKNVWNSIESWVSDKISWLADKITFWDSGKSKINGSHRIGSNYIPYDNYVAELHRGEMILTAPEAERYRNGLGNGGTQSITNNLSPTFNIYTTNGNPKEISRQIQKDIEKMNRGYGYA